MEGAFRQGLRFWHGVAEFEIRIGFFRSSLSQLHFFLVLLADPFGPAQCCAALKRAMTFAEGYRDLFDPF